jgi:hypothetical protein
MENLEDSTLLSLPTSSATEQQQTVPVSTNGAQQVSLPTTTPLGTEQLASTTQLASKPTYVNNPYGPSTGYPPMGSYNYQQNYSQAGYPATQQAFSNIVNPYGPAPSGTPGSYPHSAYSQSQQGSASAQANASPSQLSTHGYTAYAPYSASSASYAQSYPISSQYAQNMNSHASSYQPMPQPSTTYQPPSGQSLMTQMNNNQGLALPKATTPRAGPTKRRRASEDTPKPVKPVPSNESDNWERGKYQPTVRKRAKKNYDDEEDDDIDDDIEEEDDDEILQRTERKSSRERKPSAKKGGDKESKKSSSVNASPRVTPKKKEEKVVEEEEEDIEVEQGNLEVELEFPEDGLIETDEENHTKKYNKIIFNGNPYVVGDTIAFWPEGKKGRPPMGTIKSFSTDGENNTVDCCWFYRVEETPLKGKRRQKIGAREVFLSEHTDPNACESIWKKVSIKSKYEVPDLDEYVKEADSYYYCSKFNHLELTFEDL